MAHVFALQHFGDLRIQGDTGIAFDGVKTHGYRCLDD
jgi:hypothetical protein